MKAFFNTHKRNLAAQGSNSEYEKRLAKATYSSDGVEPKEKHVVFLIECLSGEHADDISYEDAYVLFRKRYEA